MLLPLVIALLPAAVQPDSMVVAPSGEVAPSPIGREGARDVPTLHSDAAASGTTVNSAVDDAVTPTPTSVPPAAATATVPSYATGSSGEAAGVTSSPSHPVDADPFGFGDLVNGSATPAVACPQPVPVAPVNVSDPFGLGELVAGDPPSATTPSDSFDLSSLLAPSGDPPPSSLVQRPAADGTNALVDLF